MTSVKFHYRPLLALVVLQCIFNQISVAQDNPYEIAEMKSPNAAAFQKYGDIPVNYHTGVPNISIPIHTINHGSINVPISLSYHASGLKVAETASWVGAGWVLNVGGSISRTVKGAPDDLSQYSPNAQLHGHYSHYGYNSELSNADSVTNYHLLMQQIYDGEPDIFFVNAGGFSGKFYFDDDRTPVFFENKNIKVEVDYDFSNGFHDWVVTNTDGMKYYFGESGKHEKTYQFSESSGPTYISTASSWMLTKIESPDKKYEVIFNYTNEKYSYYTVAMKNLDVANAPQNRSAETELVKNNVDGYRLSSIDFGTSNIVFDPGNYREDLGEYNVASDAEGTTTEARTLGAIKLNYTNGLEKTYKFTYGYFEDTVTPLNSRFLWSNIVRDKKRLKLLEVQEYNKAETESIKPYKFQYYETEQIPRRLSLALDHWGYNNGKSNDSTVPVCKIDDVVFEGTADRDPSFPEMMAGTLTQIEYPTGGYSKFDFEGHTSYVDYSKYEYLEIGNLSAGYDGSLSGSTNDIALSVGAHKIDVSVTSGSVLGYTFTLKRGSTSVQSAFLEPGDALTLDVDITVTGSHTMELVTLNSNTGHGATSILTARTPVQYAGNELVGGLRVKTITSQDGNSSTPDIVKNYIYDTNNNQSSGILYGRPTYISVWRNDYIKRYGYRGLNNVLLPPYDEMGCEQVYPTSPLPLIISSNGLFSMPLSQGNHIGYSYVKVGLGVNNSGGHSIYQYKVDNTGNYDKPPIAITEIEDRFCDSEIPNYPSAPLPYNPDRGRLVIEQHLNSNNILKEYIIYDDQYATDHVEVPCVMGVNNDGNHLYTFYTLSSLKKTYSSMEKRVYDEQGGHPVITKNETFFGSNFHSLASSSKVTIDAEELKSEYKYAPDYRTTTCHGDTVQLTLFDDYYEAEKQIALDSLNARLSVDSCGFSTGCWGDVQRMYDEDLRWVRNGFVTYRTNARQTLQNCLDTNIYPSAQASLSSVLNLVENNQLSIPIESTQWIGTEFKESTLFEYDDTGTNRSTGLYTIYPTKAYSLKPYANSVLNNYSFTESELASNQLTKDTSYEEEVSYTYSNGRPVEITARNGVKTSYIWGSDHSLLIAKIENASFSELGTLGFGSSFVAGPEGLTSAQFTTLRNGLPNSLITTYEHKLGLGIVAITDPNGITNDFEYDDFGRLIHVKDFEGNVLSKTEYHYKGQTSNQ